MSACLRFFYTISIESINHIHFFTLKFLSYFAKKISYAQDNSSHRDTLFMKIITEKQEKKIRQRIIDACKNDSGHTMKLCAYSK